MLVLLEQPTLAVAVVAVTLFPAAEVMALMVVLEL
jgi:hypothetical protein